jgi:hypothetical protein
MKKLTPATLLGLALLGTFNWGCNKDPGEDTGMNEPGPSHPQVTEWETVVDKLPFPTSGDTKINTITVGRKEYNDNFANRGDIEVFFDQDSDVITIEMRKYDFSDDITAKGDEATGVVGTFERLSLWAYNENGSAPAKPTKADMEDPEKNCQLETWKDGCSVYVYSDGQSQPLRSGVDFKVHLPKAYRGELNVQTEDNENEPTFPRRGNITVTGDGAAGWCSSGSLKMSAGIGKVKLCRELVPAPTCPAAQLEMCENFKDEMGEDAAWAPECPCQAMLFGQIRIESLAPWAADITVDIPDTTWLNATVANQSSEKPHDCKPVIDNCSGSCEVTDDSEYSKAAEFNYPSEAAPKGAGFNLTVLSAGCTQVKYFKSPDDWSEDAEPESALRGKLKLCTGCLD